MITAHTSDTATRRQSARRHGPGSAKQRPSVSGISAEFPWLSAIRRISHDEAAAHADDVDRRARFPHEVFSALRIERLLSAPIPTALGGAGLNIAAQGELCATLAQTCASSAMVLAMHYIQVGILVRHATQDPAIQAALCKIADEQCLLASITSEEGTFGDTRRSICAVETLSDSTDTLHSLRLVKEATTGSYVAQADMILVTARRTPDATENDQVLVVLNRHQMDLTQVGTWDTLGMRGTCSPGFHTEATFGPDAVATTPYAEISSHSMLPLAHILWAALWTGIASGAYAKAALRVRSMARSQPGELPPAATRLSALGAQLQLMKLQWQSIAQEVDALPAHDGLESMTWAIKLNHLKTSSADLAPQIVHGALQIVGIMGYKNDTSLSLGRAYRDALSASLMVSNERIHGRCASMLTVLKDH